MLHRNQRNHVQAQTTKKENNNKTIN